MGERARSRSRRRFSATQAAHGRDAVGVFGGGSLTNEKAYLLGKFARVALGTSNIDYNGRFCMSSAAAGASKALGLDRGLPFPLEDIPHAEAILLVGGNMAETMPPIMRYFEAQQRNGGALIVADPRRSATAQWAKLHLRVASRIGCRARQRAAASADSRLADRHRPTSRAAPKDSRRCDSSRPRIGPSASRRSPAFRRAS